MREDVSIVLDELYVTAHELAEQLIREGRLRRSEVRLPTRSEVVEVALSVVPRVVYDCRRARAITGRMIKVAFVGLLAAYCEPLARALVRRRRRRRWEFRGWYAVYRCVKPQALA